MRITHAQKRLSDPAGWIGMMEGWFNTSPLARPEVQQKVWTDSLNLWGQMMNQYGLGTSAQPFNFPQRQALCRCGGATIPSSR
jgi:polyhydroxyalkanoate synthase